MGFVETNMLRWHGIWLINLFNANGLYGLVTPPVLKVCPRPGIQPPAGWSGKNLDRPARLVQNYALFNHGPGPGIRHVVPTVQWRLTAWRHLPFNVIALLPSAAGAPGG